MSAISEYLDHLSSQCLLSPVIASFTITAEREFADRGYFRARLTLINGDFLEVSEYVILQQGKCATQEYRYQWMDASQQHLRKRWDNAKHFPDLPNFPHHIHDGSETHVVSGKALSILELLVWFEKESDVLA